MINVKLVVLFVYIIAVHTWHVKYCEICLNHTLCKYTKAGPSSVCKKYDSGALLTEKDVSEIIKRINERRNFVAKGLSRNFPKAANMRKIEWSEELATFAQRWADQCDSSMRPDTEDECRDLVDTKVGQNIATVTGPTAGLRVKSFVEMWYMEGWYYEDSVSYYNLSIDHKAIHFTQLIWADTNIVGCGRARFQVLKKNVNMTIERLVCNFAPKGNIRGKPVYAIGVPATQCPDNLVPDDKYKGLCSVQYQENVTKCSTLVARPTTSLFRILNLSNNSVKQEIDPVGNNLMQIKFNGNKSDDQRNQKTRHVFLNKTFADTRYDSSSHVRHFWSNPISTQKRVPQNYQQNEDYSNYYDRTNYNKNNEQKYKNKTSNFFWKYIYSPESLRTRPNKQMCINRHHHCTRKAGLTTVFNKDVSSDTPSQCTRGPESTRQPLTIIHELTLTIPKYHNQTLNSPWSRVITTLPTTTHCTCDTNCQCLNLKCPTNDYANFNMNTATDIIKQSEDRKYYNLLPNIATRSGDVISEKPILTHFMYWTTRQRNKWFIENINRRDRTESFAYDNGDSENHGLINHTDDPRSVDIESDYSYGDFNSRLRNKRNHESENFKPFWQVDGFSNNKASQLKALKFTTISNKRNRKIDKMTSTKLPYATESITLKLKDIASPFSKSRKQPITEKYLSFDELMHIRKFTEDLGGVNARRDIEETTVKTTSTSEYTANTKFIRLKYCTRKLTCTWTGPTVTGSDGKQMQQIGNLNKGSRTPPGYVDGCTRTSTCTREFMNRNKMITRTVQSTVESTAAAEDDEDYCEKRSLDVNRRNINTGEITEENLGYQEAFTDIPMSTDYVTNTTIDEETNSLSMPEKTTSESENCVCEINVRRKRNGLKNKSTCGRNDRKLLIKEFYYSLLRKNNQGNRYRNCICSAGFITIHCRYLLLILISILYLNFNNFN